MEGSNITEMQVSVPSYIFICLTCIKVIGFVAHNQ